MGHFETCPDKMKTFAAIVLAFAAVAVQADPEFKACAGFEDNSYVDPWKLTINPDPIVAKEGALSQSTSTPRSSRPCQSEPTSTSSSRRTESPSHASQSLDFPSASDPASTTPMTFWL